MNIHITGRHFEITQALRDHITERFSQTGKHFDRVLDTHVILSVERENQIAEATVQIPHQRTLHAKSESGDMYASIDMTADKIKAQIQKQKEKAITERDHGDGGEGA